MQQYPLIASLLLLCSCAAAQAQTDAGSLTNQQERQQKRLPERLTPPEREPERPALQAGAGLKVRVKSVHFTGASQLASEAALQALVADAIGKELDFAALEQLAQRVTEHLRKQGWFLARAYLPRQDVTDGVIEINLRAGRLDGAAGQGAPYTVAPSGKFPLRIQLDRVKAMAAALLPAGATASQGDLERALLLINDLPGVAARAHLEPGAEPDSTRVVIDLEEGPLFSEQLYVDNYGNRDTGTEQFNLAGEFRDASGRGDLVQLSGTLSPGLVMRRVGYTVPLGDHGLKLSGSWSLMEYDIVRGLGLAAGLKGQSQTSGLSLSYPVLRSRQQNISLAAGITRKALKDDSAAGVLRDKRLGNWNLSVSGDRLDELGGGGMNSGALALSFGRVDLSRNPGDAASDAATYRAAGYFSKLNFNASRLQKLPGAYTLLASVSGQAVDRNLDSSEKFILGGPNGIRAYPGSEGMGDQGWMTNLELRYDLPGSSPWGSVQLSGFYDRGLVSAHYDPQAIPNPTATGRNGYALSGWGVGATLSKLGSHTVRLAWARKIGSNPGRSIDGLDADGHRSPARLWLQAIAVF